MTRTTRKGDWTSLREWTNLAIAGGVLIVAIVSLWTTTQISGLEDYFRSEISRRNSDLNTLADQGRRLNALADERERRLANLETTTEEVTASNLAAQGKLLTTQQELSRLSFDVVNAKQTLASSEARLGSLTEQSQKQSSLIDLFRRQRFFERAHLRMLYEGIRLSEDRHYAVMDGEAAYHLITNWSVGNLDPELAAYLPGFLSNARNTCEWIRDYRPQIPAVLPEPDARPRDNAAAQKEWDKRWAEFGDSQRRALDASEGARSYIDSVAASCMCRALATADHPASAICSGYANPPAKPPS